MNSVPALADFGNLAPIIAAAFALAVLLIGTILIFRRRPGSMAVKLLGSMMILVVAFGANHWSIYAISI